MGHVIRPKYASLEANLEGFKPFAKTVVVKDNEARLENIGLMVLGPAVISKSVTNARSGGWPSTQEKRERAILRETRQLNERPSPDPSLQRG